MTWIFIVGFDITVVIFVNFVIFIIFALVATPLVIHSGAFWDCICLCNSFLGFLCHIAELFSKLVWQLLIFLPS